MMIPVVPASLNLAWFLVFALKYSGLIVALSGVVVFGWYFVSGNAQAVLSGSEEVPRTSWRGRGPMTGAAIVGAGFILTLLAILLASTLPARL